jgi:hypothetical protein
LSNNFKTRLLTPEDGQAIIDLYFIVRPQAGRGDLDYWRWQFVDNPVGKIFSFVAEDKSSGEIVSQGALLPAWFNIDGKKIMASQSVRSMTHPAHTGKGIFGSLAKESYTYAACNGTGLLYGFPVPEAFPVFMRLGWTDMGNIPCLMKIINRKAQFINDLQELPSLLKFLNPRKLFLKHGVSQESGITKIWTEVTKRLAKSQSEEQEDNIKAPNSTGKFKIERINTFDQRFDELWLKVKGTLPISTWRDSEYLNWRYCSRPDKKYGIFAAEEDKTLVGYMVAGDEQLENTGCIVDFLSLSDKTEVALPLIAAAIDYFKNQGMHTVTCHVLEHNPLYKFLIAEDFTRYGSGSHFILRTDTPDFPAAALDYEQWYLMAGDTDTY